MKAAETRASSAIADWIALTSVPRSATTAEIETFMIDVSTTRTNMAIASRTGRRRSAAPAAGTWASTALVMSLPFARRTRRQVERPSYGTGGGRRRAPLALHEDIRILVRITTRSSQELRCRGAKQDDLRLRRRPSSLPAGPAAC